MWDGRSLAPVEIARIRCSSKGVVAMLWDPQTSPTESTCGPVGGQGKGARRLASQDARDGAVGPFGVERDWV